MQEIAKTLDSIENRKGKSRPTGIHWLGMMSPKFKHINAIWLGEYQIKKYILVFERERKREQFTNNYDKMLWFIKSKQRRWAGTCSVSFQKIIFCLCTCI